MSIHMPSLPSLSVLETPLAASREIVEAIGDAADAAVDAAAGAVRARTRSRSSMSKRVVIVVAVAVVVWLVVRRSQPTGSVGERTYPSDDGSRVTEESSNADESATDLSSLT